MTQKNQKFFNILLILFVLLLINSNNNPLIFNVIAKNNEQSKSNNKSDEVWSKLRGSWKKVSFKEKSNNEFTDFDWHNGGELYLIYDGLGGCAIISQSKNYSDSFNKKNIEALDLIPKSESYYYFANCKINKDTIEHTKILHSNPNEVGEIAKRKFRVISNPTNKMLDTLILIPLNFNNYAELKLVRVN